MYSFKRKIINIIKSFKRSTATTIELLRQMVRSNKDALAKQRSLQLNGYLINTSKK